MRYSMAIIETLSEKTKAPSRPKGKTKRRKTTRMKREVTSLVVQLAGRAPRPLMPSHAVPYPAHGWSHLQPTRMDGSVRLGVAVSAFSAVSEDARAASAKAPPPDMGGDVLGGSAKIAASAAESIASAAAARLLQQMEAALEAESERLQGWLGKLESIAELRMKTGKVIGFSHEERKVLNSGELEAMMVAEQTANAIASAACLTD